MSRDRIELRFRQPQGDFLGEGLVGKIVSGIPAMPAKEGPLPTKTSLGVPPAVAPKYLTLNPCIAIT